tara:strand:- start:34 stop:1272 length:1239 start_codon:yes stop_codon:yes gene_type:complete
MSKLKSARGTHDLLGNDILKYNYIVEIISQIAKNYDFNEIITPIFENSELFKKPLGEHSDVVLKEMYSFEDLNKNFLTLRPEYTAPMIRAAISNNLFDKLPLKLFGFGPMFRRERPQKGRYRQFNQINFEIIGISEIVADVELIILAYQFLKKLKIIDKVILQINSLGDINTLSKYKSALSEYYNKFENELSEESKNKIYSNPLRILDSKNSDDIKINLTAPKIKKFYSKNAEEFFDLVKANLKNFNINYILNENLVRGLDYYCHTVFEFKTNELGSQDTIIGGGRYDGLVKTIGGPNIPGVGWASGIERISMLIDEIDKNVPDVQLIIVDEKSQDYAFKLLFLLRDLKFKVRYDYKTNLKKSLKSANQDKIKYAIIIGETEVKNNNYTIKDLFAGTQNIFKYEELIKFIKS